MAVEAETVEFINCNNKEYEICDAKAREKFDAIDNLKDMAYEEKINYPTVTDLNNAVVNLQRNFQAGVEAIGDACTRKGSTPASSSLEDTVAAIDAITTGGNYSTLDVSFGPTGTVYDAKDYPGIDAQNIVRVVSPEAPFTVKFFADDRQTVIKTDATVPYKGNASCTLLDGTIKNGQYFIGWNPNPVSVTENMNCYPTYGEYIIDPTDIQDSWETICADGGAHYPILAKKPLIIDIYNDEYMNAYNSFDGVSEGMQFIRASNKLKSQWHPDYFLINSNPNEHSVIARVQCHMIKVAEGEDGSHSTWISTGMAHLIPYDGRMMRGQLDGTDFVNSLMTTYKQVCTYPNEPLSVDYGDSAIRYFLETILFRNLPSALKENIKAVHKSYKGVANEAVQSKTPLDKEVLATVWALSRKELHTFISNNLSVSSAWGEETNGIDYSLQYMPNYRTTYAGAKAYLRSMFNFTNVNGWSNSLSCMNFNNLRLENTQDINDDTNYLYVPFGFCL